VSPRIKRLQRWLKRRYLFVQIFIDVTAWAVGLWLAMVLRFDFALDPDKWSLFDLRGLLAAIVVAALLQVVAGTASGLYRARWRFGSFDEVAHLVAAVAITATTLSVLNQWLFDRLVPASVALAGGLVALVIMAAARYTWRLSAERRMRPTGDDLSRALVFGAGEGGVQIITAMLRNPDSPYLPVGLLDDHPGKANLRIKGVPVLGGREEMRAASARLDADTLIIAVPSAGSELIRRLTDLASECGLAVRVLPPIGELLGGSIGVGDLRPPTEADLLGRREISTDLDAISGYLTGRRVLVTGAGGSIGSELCVQIARLAPETLVMLDRDESALHAVQLRLDGRAMLDTRDLVVADIRDRPALEAVFDEHHPDVVFHAAALKHLPLLEQYPVEALKTNVDGTQHVLGLSIEHGVARMVNISTDKAADPVSVLGYTKRIAEMLTAAAATRSTGTFLSVRFGNVLGSRGSVLTAFQAQVEAGGPITVTDPDVTRYFMTVEEAVQLVIQAGAAGSDGEALVLDMGEPVRIDDVAHRLAEQAERPVEVVYTGLRPGEKLHEVLFGAGESGARPVHPLISHVGVPPLEIAVVQSRCEGLSDRAALTSVLRDLALRRSGTTTGST
jgi:FlaA1/EpsC-like NDP-sugar epimerase